LPIESVGFMPGGPLLAALIVIPLTQGVAGLKRLGLRMIRWRVRWYWYVVAIGLPLAVLALTVGLNVALGASTPSLAGLGSVSTVLMVFAIRLVNPGDGALGEEPGWRGFALPGLQTTRSPLPTTLILAVLITGWHLPTFVLGIGFQTSLFVGGVVGTVAVTFWYTWLFNRTGGSVLMTLISHAAQGTIQIGVFWSASADVAQAFLVYGVVASAVAMGWVVFDRKAWHAPAAPETTTPPPQAIPPKGAAPATPA
jgi:uncharacterized protein